MALIATLVVGANNATSKAGLSAPLSTPADRTRFLALHRSAAAIIIGKESAVVEDYRTTQVPIFVLSRQHEGVELPHPMMELVTVDDDLATISRSIASQFDGDVIIEAGIKLLKALISAGAVDHLALSISPIEGNGHFVNLDELLSGFSIEKEDEIEGTRLLECRYNRDPSNR
jgi:riboflavin biosynthesis pyrimidine reductase